jgi:CubicO group peptidase (beta-lactamase class C family)
MFKFFFFLILIVALNASRVQAQIDNLSALFTELKTLDSLFFERGFNQCDQAFLESRLTKDLRFYHDQGGFQDREAFLENTRKYICADPGKKPIRKLQPSSLQVFPLYQEGNLYGAIQQGIHHFYIREKGKPDLWTSTARFTHVWLRDSAQWKLSEVLSYDHQAPVANTAESDIEQLLKDNKVPALGMGIIEKGKLTKVKVYGTLDKKQTAPYNTIFKVASLTKPVFALTVLKLIDAGLLDLDEPLYKYWIDPDIQNDKRHRKLTPRIVLSHQTGFPNWRYMTETKKLAFQFDPGTQYQYSGEGFEYLRRAVEKMLGRSIEELAGEYLFGPLQMNDTHFYWDKAIDETRYARNYNEKGNSIATVKYYQANAAANLLTTVEDYGKFLAYVVNGAGLSPDLYQEMMKQQVRLKENDYFGLGWEILAGFSNNEIALLHTGKDPGVSTLAIWFPQSRNGYLIFLNGDNVNNIYEALLTKRLYLGKELWNKR